MPEPERGSVELGQAEPGQWVHIRELVITKALAADVAPIAHVAGNRIESLRGQVSVQLVNDEKFMMRVRRGEGDLGSAGLSAGGHSASLF